MLYILSKSEYCLKKKKENKKPHFNPKHRTEKKTDERSGKQMVNRW